MGWHYPFHVQNENHLMFGNSLNEDENTSTPHDTLYLIKLKNSFSRQVVEYFKDILPIDTTLGYLIENARIYNDNSDSLIYSIGIKKFKSNTQRSIMPCEGCEAIEGNAIFVSGNRALFRIKNKAVLEFKNWMD